MKHWLRSHSLIKVFMVYVCSCVARDSLADIQQDPRSSLSFCRGCSGQVEKLLQYWQRLNYSTYIVEGRKDFCTTDESCYSGMVTDVLAPNWLPLVTAEGGGALSGLPTIVYLQSIMEMHRICWAAFFMFTLPSLSTLQHVFQELACILLPEVQVFGDLLDEAV